MNVSGEFMIDAPRERVFNAIRDARFFASCIDGVQELTEIDPTHYDAVFETKVAYLKFRFKVTVEITKIQEPDELEAKVEGTPLGMVGRLTATSRTKLTADGDKTKVDYSVETALTGKLGSLGQPVLKSKAKQMEKQFAERLQAAFAEGRAP
jgi:carbon monoxide dehydrogenase subunit G